MPTLNSFYEVIETVGGESIWIIGNQLDWIVVKKGKICLTYAKGGFQLLDLIITELKSHMTC